MEKRRDELTGIHDSNKLDQTSDSDGSPADVYTCVSVVTCCYGFNNEHKGCGRLQHSILISRGTDWILSRNARTTPPPRQLAER